MNGRVKILTITGIVVMLATVLIFVFARPILFPGAILGVAFLLYSEIVFFGGLAFVERWSRRASGIIARAGMGITIGIYAIAVFFSSLIYMNLHFVLFRGFLILQTLLLACAATISVIFAAVSKSRFARDSKVLAADAMVRRFVDELTLIQDMSGSQAGVGKLVEAMKYSDASSVADADVEIEEVIAELKAAASAEERDEVKFNKNVEKIEFLIKKRNLQIRSAKQGGI